ncbi:MAG: hypothetical protein ACREMG_12940 [Gemmatimonadales bacterium]
MPTGSVIEGRRMIDLLYVLGTIGFFAAMLAYVRGCERLGRGSDEETR